MKLVIALIALVVGAIVFHLLSPRGFTPLASNWSTVDVTVDITLYITAFVFVAVNLFMAYAIYRYRHRGDSRAHYEPENKKLETWLTVVTAVGVAAMLAPGLVVWANFIKVPEDAHVVEALGEQWQWRYRLPGGDGELGEVDSRYITEDNPFGMSPNDPAGRDDLIVNDSELHLPIDRPVKMLLRSRDVLHNFAVPQFRVKMDLVPGTVSYVWFTPTRDGRFDVLCMELCGIAHYAMRGHVVVEAQEDFDAWRDRQPTWYDIERIPAGDPQAGRAAYAVCASCHGERAQGKKELNAPQLAGLSDWYIERQLRYYREGIRGAHEEDTYGRQMAPMAATLADAAAIRNVAAYLAGLEPQATPATVEGNASRGRSHYTHCGACHGADAQGNTALQAPRLAGQNDWYLKRQLQYFRQGIRGIHEEDQYGHQMALMARSVKDGRSTDDLVTYLSSL